MKWPTYPRYKPSGVQWLGDVPEHWGVKRFKGAARYWVSNVDKVASEDEVPVRLCNYTDVYYHDNIRPTMNLMETTATADEVRRFGLKVGDVVITKDSETWNDIAVPALVVESAPDLVCGYHLAIIRPKESILLGGYLLRALQSLAVNQQFQVAATGVTRYGLPKSSIGEAWLPLPSLAEQRAIADFLDRQTSMIDTLVAKKRTLIERLKEKRTALISRTVTRGLPPDAARAAGLDPHPKLKPSGIDWLGDVPEHWSVSPLKFLVSTPVTDGPHETPEILEEGVPFVSAEAISGGQVNFEAIRGYISLEDHRRYARKYKPSSGDIYMVKSGATTGRVAMVENKTNFNIWSPLAAIRCNPKSADRNFVFLYLQSREFQAAVELSWSYGTQQNIGMGVIQNLHVPVPLLSEQAIIAKYLSSATKRIDSLITKIETAIDRLQEYRTALITAAVTGKIDVRGLAPAPRPI
jgi:type I restriction enzyme S subunit